MKVEHSDCIDELSVLKALDQMYKYIGVDIYAHADLELCPVNPRILIDKTNQRPSNARVRNFITQFRVFGEDAFWQQLVGQLNISKEEGLKAMKLAPKVEEVKTPTLPIVKLDIPFEISEAVGGDRPMEDILSIIQGLNKMGVTKWPIMAALEKMTDKPEMDANEPPDGQISSFIAKGSVAQIHEMIKLVMS
jgi:hypothetical protein